MKGFKCFGLLLLLSITVGLSLNASSDVSALKHEYVGITPISYIFPNWDFEDDELVFDLSDPDGYPFTTAFSVGLQDEAWPSDFTNDYFVHPLFNQSTIVCDSDESSPDCVVNDVSSMFNATSRTNIPGYVYSFSLDGVSPSIVTGTQDFPFNYNQLRTLSASGLTNISPVVGLNPEACPSPWISGWVTDCNRYFNYREYYDSNVLPYWYSSDGFYVHSSAINPDNGISYSHTFSLSDMFNYDFPRISSLNIPFSTNDNYWYTESNLYEGRNISFNGTFEFDGSFAWNPSAVSSGSFKLNLRYITKYFNSSFPGGVGHASFNCTTNLIQVEGLTRLEYSCPVTLPEDMLYLLPELTILGGSQTGSTSTYDYIWETNDKWRFGSCFIITDNDDTPGSNFNETLTGGGTFIGDAQNDFPDDSDQDFFYSLTHLFDFSMINPFTPIFALFTNQSTCASIPTIASMIHSSETQVCPWFSAETRAIVTPVVGIVSTMLIFGFAVRWLGSRSGNFMEDSDSHEIGSIRVGRKGRK